MGRAVGSAVEASVDVKLIVALVLNLLLVSLALCPQARANDDDIYTSIEQVAKHPADKFWNRLTRHVIRDLGLPKKFNIVPKMVSDSFFSIPKESVY
jgi:hypothetical protein